jgi:hypothetical protein
MNRILILPISILLFSCTSGNRNNETVSSETLDLINDTLISDIKRIKQVVELSDIDIDTLQRINCGIYKIGSDDDRIPGPSDYYLIASFKLRSIDTSKCKQINVLKAPLEMNSIYYKEWLPKNIVNNLFDRNKFKETSVYAANLFYKSPYLEGFFILQSDSTVYLQMQTK